MPDLLSQRLDRLAARYFGDEWAAPASRFTGVNRRTLQRIRQAGREGREEPYARGALEAFVRAAGTFQAEIETLSEDVIARDL